MFAIKHLFHLILFSTLSSNLFASTINYSVDPLTGNTWEYTFTVVNDTLVQDIEEFTILFDSNLYTNLVVGSTPVGWDPLVIQPDTALPDDGFYDALALSTGISSGNALTGFSVQFDYSGANAPGSQFFQIIDPVTFGALDSGTTQLVPLPAAVWLFASGGLMLAVSAFKRRKVPEVCRY